MPRAMKCSQCGSLLPPISSGDTSVTCTSCHATFKISRAPAKTPPPDFPPVAPTNSEAGDGPLPDFASHPLPTHSNEAFGNAWMDSEIPSPSPMYIPKPIASPTPAAPRSPQAASTKANSKPTKTSPGVSSSDSFKKTRSPMLIIGLIAGCGTLLSFCAIGFLFFFLKPKNEEEAKAAVAAKAEWEGFQVVTSADPAWKPTYPDAAPLFQPAPVWDEANAKKILYTSSASSKAFAKYQKQEQPNSLFSSESVIANPKPQWQDIDIKTFAAPALEPSEPFAIAVESGETQDREVIPISFSGPDQRLMIAQRSFVDESYPFYSFEEIENPKTGKKTFVDHPQSSISVLDLRTGKVVAKYHWRVFIENGPCLSPDGQRIVSVQRPAGARLENETALGFAPVPNERSIAVFSPGKKNPDRWIEIPGMIYWMDFADERMLTTLVGTEESRRLIAWNVDSGERLWELDLGSESLPPPTQWITNNQEVHLAWDMGTPFHRGVRQLGLVSPSRRFLAVRTKRGALLIDLPAKQLVGELLCGAKESSPVSLLFSQDEQNLWCSATHWNSRSSFLDCWSLRNGALVKNLSTVCPPASSLFHSPIDGTILFRSRWNIEKSNQKADMRLMHLVDCQRGEPLATFPFSIVQQWGNQHILTTTRALAPDFARTAPKSCKIQLQILSMENVYEDQMRSNKDSAKKRRDQESKQIEREDEMTFLLYSGSCHDNLIESVKGREIEKPKIAMIDRSHAKQLQDKPEDDWAATPLPAAHPRDQSIDKEPVAKQRLHWPASIGLTEGASLSYLQVIDPPVLPDLHVIGQARIEVYWVRHDRETFEPIGQPIPLWQSKHSRPYTDEAKRMDMIVTIDEPLIALRPDGNQLAICDSEESGRIDIFEKSGKRITGWKVSDNPIEAAFWAHDDRLWIQCESDWICVDPTVGQVVFERSDNYCRLHEAYADRPWFVAWASTHAEIIDTKTGVCLKRLVCGDLSGSIVHIATSPDQKNLAASFTERQESMRRPGEFTGVVWSLTDGTATVFPFGVQDHLQLQSLNWIGNDLLLGVGMKPEVVKGRAELIDLKLRECTAVLSSLDHHFHGWFGQSTPEGRIWRQTINTNPPARKSDVPRSPLFNQMYTPIQLSNHIRDSEDLEAPGRELFDPRKWPVQVHIKLENDKEAEVMSNAIAREFVKTGFQLGTGGWILKYSGVTLNQTVKIDPQTTIHVSDIDSLLTFVDPDGKEVISRKGNVYSEMLQMALKGDGKSMNESDTRRFGASYRRRATEVSVNKGVPDTPEKIAELIVMEVLFDRELRNNGKEHVIPIEVPF